MSKPDEKVTLVDTVEYEGLKKGVEYRVVGTLMNKETGEALSSEGSVKVPFTFDGSTLSGQEVVVFEKLYYVAEDGTETEVASHEDLTDEGQTVLLTDTPPVPEEPAEPSALVKTGDETNNTLYIAIAVVAILILAGAGGYLIYQRKKK